MERNMKEIHPQPIGEVILVTRWATDQRSGPLHNWNTLIGRINCSQQILTKCKRLPKKIRIFTLFYVNLAPHNQRNFRRVNW